MIYFLFEAGIGTACFVAATAITLPHWWMNASFYAMACLGWFFAGAIAEGECWL